MAHNNTIDATVIEEFMVAGKQTVTNFNMKQIELYAKLCKEECVELITAANKLQQSGGITVENLAEFLDACGDLAWVAYGAAFSAGANPQQIHDEIATSNMSKITKGVLVKHPTTGKILKPASFVLPDLEYIARDILELRPAVSYRRTFAQKPDAARFEI